MGDPPRALSSPPALWTWVTVAALAGWIAIASVLVTLHDDRQKQEQFAATSQRQIAGLDKLLKPGARKAPLVVVLGHSLIWAALQRDGIAQRNSPADIDLVVLTADFKHPHWFETLLPALHRLRPDLLVVDSELLRVEVTIPTFAERVRHLMRKIWQPKPAATDCRGVLRAPIDTTYIKGYQDWFNPSAMSLHRLPDLAALKSEGIAVDVLQMPRSDALELAAPNLIEWRKAEAALVENQGIGVWTPTGEWPEADYCDHAHMSLAGAVQFNAWFAERLTQTFNPAPKSEP